MLPQTSAPLDPELPTGSAGNTDATVEACPPASSAGVVVGPGENADGSLVPAATQSEGATRASARALRDQ